jgi:hypothetical protein
VNQGEIQHFIAMAVCKSDSVRAIRARFPSKHKAAEIAERRLHGLTPGEAQFVIAGLALNNEQEQEFTTKCASTFNPSAERREEMRAHDYGTDLLWTPENRVSNMLLYWLSVVFGFIVYDGPAGGDWGWQNVIHFDDWPGELREHWLRTFAMPQSQQK